MTRPNVAPSSDADPADSVDETKYETSQRQEK